MKVLASVTLADRNPRDDYLDIVIPGHGPRPWEVLARGGLEDAVARLNGSRDFRAAGLLAVVVGDRLEIRSH